MNINSIYTDQVVFLQRLKSIAKYPKSLYLIGKLPTEIRPTVAIIGTRKPTPYGREVAYKLAYDLARQGVVIVSGLAIGVDTVVHKAALDAGGITIAVLAGGLDTVHPSSNQELSRNIVQSGGALLSEYPNGITPRKWQFVARNRIESGMSNGVLVVEAASSSGTLQTATFAKQQGREVMAVPGNITNPMAEGANSLIRLGATLVTHANDVLEKIGQAKQLTLPLHKQDHILLRLLANGVNKTEDLQTKSNLEPAKFNEELTLLELDGRIRSLDGHSWVVA